MTKPRCTPFLSKSHKQNKYINLDVLQSLCTSSMKSYPFSTFPYYIFEETSDNICDSMHEGNCIALSMNIKKQLQKQNIKSYIIPATVPNKYKLPDMPPYAHVAVAIPLSKTKVIIVDQAFYFMKPLIIDLSHLASSIIPSKNVYNGKMDYVGVISLNKKRKWEPEIHCAYSDDPADSWKYVLTEILNPDASIGTPYLNNKQHPFTCILDDNINMVLYIEKNDKHIRIKLPNDEYIFHNAKDIPSDIKKSIQSLMTRPHTTFEEVEKYIPLDHKLSLEDI
jgi:hypothetical protein